ncbi:hypothetical protein CCUS01_02696 [Colletotrichum cuscutae]|uniref:Uncharacterized protein n=1 Tax=Colletotrichum cuscutae TaxID=1209917 RepID=A0AAJ0DNT5_9PEZI|nr:hypothetical protein CCUS01_02696 [Colletotrichum cuscutae]
MRSECPKNCPTVAEARVSPLKYLGHETLPIWPISIIAASPHYECRYQYCPPIMATAASKQLCKDCPKLWPAGTEVNLAKNHIQRITNFRGNTEN